jgi:hypothetical protein
MDWRPKTSQQCWAARCPEHAACGSSSAEEDRIEAKPNAGGRRSMLSAQAKATLLELLEAHPDAFAAGTGRAG